MGCDIHVFAEYRKPGEDYWHGLFGQARLSRNYLAFGMLAGVRCGGAVVAPRGIPEDLGFWSKDEWWLYISDHKDADQWDGFATAEKAEGYAAMGSKFLFNKDGTKRAVEHPDWHTPSWLSGEEWRSVVSGVEHGQEYRAIGSALGILESEGYETRIVFWFDN